MPIDLETTTFISWPCWSDEYDVVQRTNEILAVFWSPTYYIYMVILMRVYWLISASVRLLLTFTRRVYKLNSTFAHLPHRLYLFFRILQCFRIIVVCNLPVQVLCLFRSCVMQHSRYNCRCASWLKRTPFVCPIPSASLSELCSPYAHFVFAESFIFWAFFFWTFFLVQASKQTE